MIPQPDLFIYYVLGYLGMTIMGAGIVLGIKYDSMAFAYIGMALGFVAILFGLNGSVGFGDHTEGELDLWRDQVTIEYMNTECPYMENLSNEYENSKIDRYTVNAIQDEIESHYIYKCVDTREAWYLD